MNATPASTPSSPRPARLITALRLLALILFFGTGVFWAVNDGRLGWSQNRVPVKQVDELTGIESVSYVDRFVPGVDFLAVGLGAAVACFAASFLPFLRQSSSR